MKSLVITVLLFLTLSVGAKAQENAKTFTPEEQAVIDLSNNKWDWMAEKNADKLAELFHESAQFVHMGGYWGKEQELNTIPSGTRKQRYMTCRSSLPQVRQRFTAVFI